MYSKPADALADSTLAQEASELLRSCVHCGFCLPACPTYGVTGSELDSPRGRIYLIKEMLEQGAATTTARVHLDRCLTCRACETACPSGVQYGRLADLGRELIEEQPTGSPRNARTRFVRFALATVATRRALFTPLVRIGQALLPALPATLQKLLPERNTSRFVSPAARPTSPAARHARRMAVLAGCVQPGLAPQINAAAKRVLDQLGISLLEADDIGCCGALEHHLGRSAAALDQVRRNAAAGERLLESGFEAIISTASGCGTFAKDYGHVLRHTEGPVAAAGKRVGAATRDLCEVIDPVALAAMVAARGAPQEPVRVAWQSPCSLQHGQRSSTAGKVEALLRAAGCELVATRNATMCCGSAGTYSILQPELARELRARKLEALLDGQPTMIATANIGCLEHLRQVSPVPVRHWIEIVDARLCA